MKRKTRILIEIEWQDEVSDHPMGWDIQTQLRRDPFAYSDEKIRVVSFEDVDDRGNPDQV